MHALETRPLGRSRRDSRIELMKFRFQMLIDKQQSLQCSMDVAIACCDDFLDSNIGSFGSHTNPLHNHWGGIILVKMGRNSVSEGIISWLAGIFAQPAPLEVAAAPYLQVAAKTTENRE